MITYPKLVNGLKSYGGDFLDQLTSKDIPFVHNLIGKTQPPKWHPEGNAYVHTKLVIDRCLQLGGNHIELFSCLTHDLGKSITPDHLLPHHYGHEHAGVLPVHQFVMPLRLHRKLVRWRGEAASTTS